MNAVNVSGIKLVIDWNCTMFKLIVLCHLRRTHRRRWRNIWGKYPSLLVVRRVRVVPSLLEHHRCQAVQPVRVVLWVLGLLVDRRVLEFRVHQRVLVVLPLQRDLVHQELVVGQWLGFQVVLSLHLCLALRAVLAGRVVHRGLRHRPFLGCLAVRSVQVRRVLQVVRAVRVDRAGTVCKAADWARYRSPVVGDQGNLVVLVVQVDQVFRPFLAFLLGQGRLASSSSRIQARLVASLLFCCEARLECRPF